jgi:hypothetical protein
VLREVALMEGWWTEVNWLGMHAARTGAARNALDSALEAVLDAGRWDSLESARLYAAPRHTGRVIE